MARYDMLDQAMLVSGEAPESDDEAFEPENDRYNFSRSITGVVDCNSTEPNVISSYHTLIPNSKKNKVPCENIVSRTNNYKTSKKTVPQRKLKEKNMQFYSNLTTFNKQIYIDAMNKMNITDQQLVKSQVLLQDTVTNWTFIKRNLSHIKKKMTDILSEEYIPKINI